MIAFIFQKSSGMGQIAQTTKKYNLFLMGNETMADHFGKLNSIFVFSKN